MKSRFPVLSLLAAVSVMACMFANAAIAQEAVPRFTTLPPHKASSTAASTSLPQWNGNFTDLTHKKITFTMVGANPSRNVSTTIPVFIIPIKMVYGPTNGNKTFDPQTVLPDGNTVVKNTTNSPIFNSGIDFVQGGVDLGNTQYIDAFQRGNFWQQVSTKPNYHVLLGTPTVLAEQTLTVPKADGKVANDFGITAGNADINWFDGQLQTIMASFSQIKPNTLPIFLLYDTYLTEGGCCIGGYHSANGAQPGGQTYAEFTYVDHTGIFSQDVSALSHEVGEWLDDPFIDNHVNCLDNSIMEDGDPLEGNANFGAFPYTLNGFTYNLQSLVFIGYFGAPKTKSVNSWLSFQNDEPNVCPGQ